MRGDGLGDEELARVFEPGADEVIKELPLVLDDLFETRVVLRLSPVGLDLAQQMIEHQVAVDGEEELKLSLEPRQTCLLDVVFHLHALHEPRGYPQGLAHRLTDALEVIL